MKLISTLVLLALAFTCQAKETKTLSGKVVGVPDDDTLTLLDDIKTQYKIRLIGIDAPEKGQAFGQKARAALSDRVFGKQITVKYADRDRYGCVLGDIYIGARWINLEMVQDGFTWLFGRQAAGRGRG